jgi:transposase
MTISRAEVITSIERRRRWSRADKERLVAASLEPGVSVSEVARGAGLHVSQLFRWRKELCERDEASVGPLVPVEIVPPPVEADQVPSVTGTGRRRKGQSLIEIQLEGGARVRVDRDVDADALRRVLDALVRR